MRWWILGCALAGLALAIAAGGFAEAEERLRLELEADRLWCTAGTLIVVQWEVSGGAGPYEVTVQGEERPATARAARLDCPELAAGADGALPPYGEMTVRGEAVDAEGRRASASARVLIARKLEAPSGLHLAYWNPRLSVIWDPVAGVGSLAKAEDCGRNSLPCGPYLLRYRGLGAEEWTYERTRPGRGRISWERDPRGIEEMQIAAMRHPIEAQRPEGLNWSGITRYAATREFGVIVLSAVSDRIDLEWEGIEAESATLELSGPGGAITREYTSDSEEYSRDTHYERFEQLEPDSEYRLRITNAAGESFELPVRTAPLPEGGRAPMRLELSAGRGSCTAGTETDIDWEVTGGRGPYRVEIAGAAGEGKAGAVRIECGYAAGGKSGYAPRTIHGSVVDADGALASVSIELLAGPPLPPPRLEPPQTRWRGFYVPFLVRASRVEWPHWQVAMRWREQGESEWLYSVDDLDNGPWGETGWADGSVSATGYLPTATVFETQAARLRDGREIERPEALVWSEIALVTTAAPPEGIVAESTHDSISLSWGPAVEGLNYIATLHPQPAGEDQQADTRFGYNQMGRAVEPAPPYGIAWSGLCPDTTYFAAVRSDAASNGEWDAPVGLLITTEPDPDAAEPAPLLEASAEWDRIILRWHPDGCAAHVNYRYKAYEYGTGDLVGDGYLSRGDDALVIDNLASGSTYEVRMWPDDYGAPANGEFRITLSTVEREREASPDPPPEFSIRYVYRDGYDDKTYGAFELQKHSSAGHWIELEWHVDGRRVRSFFSEFVYPSADISELPAGWYEFRARSIDRDWRATEWSEPVRAATTPLAPRIASMRYERDFLILTWNEPDEGIPIDRYVVEWRIEEGDWHRANVGTGGWGAIASAPFMEGQGAYIRLRAVSDEYGEGEPSAQRAVPLPRRHGWTTGMDARGCDEEGSGSFSFVWAFEGGVAPFRVRARPINLEWDADGIAEVETMDREGRFEFPCADGMEGDDGDLHATVAVQIADYKRPSETITIHRMRFGRSTAWYGSSASSEQLGPAYGEMPVPGRARQSVHATHVKWHMGGAGDPQAGQRWVVRTRTGEDEEWTERDLHYGSWPMGWWYVDDLEPGTRYEYAFGRYFDGGSEWSEPGVVTTLGEVTGIAMSEEGDAVIVEWDAQPDAWKYTVRLRGQGRSWWTVHDAGDGARERAVFAGAAGQGPYTAEVATPPKDATGEDESTFQLYQGPH